jgi:hypothetical protein
MVEGGRGPRLSLEALKLIGVAGHRIMQDLDRDLAAEAGVAGPVDLPYSPRADQVENLIRAEPGPAGDGELLRRGVRDRLLEKPLRLLLATQKRVHLVKKVVVPGARLLEKCLALGGRARERRMVELLHPLEVSRTRHEPAARASPRLSRRISRSSHTFANCQSPFTVRGDTFRTWAVSSTLRPPK